MEYSKRYELLKNRIFDITADDFESLALDIFHFQATYNEIYKSYLNALKINPEKIDSIYKIPFLPIQLFKSREIKTGEFIPEIIFESSGTTGMIPSKHFIKDLQIYENSFLRTFHQFYGDINDYCIIGLLPSYLERKNASLVYMVDCLIKKSHHENSGFYLYEFDQLKKILETNENSNQKTLLIGVSYALLDFSEQHKMELRNTIVMETGGMKGRREELSRSQLHDLLKNNLGVNEVHSEYGMTELLSQAYSKEKGIFFCPPWMKILIRTEDDPLSIYDNLSDSDSSFLSGGINIIDLTNINSCSFIATEDAGILYKKNGFEITGRLENSDIRGCGLMIL